MLHSSPPPMSMIIIVPTLMGICDENVTKRYYANDEHRNCAPKINSMQTSLVLRIAFKIIDEILYPLINTF